jgi:PucR C-terminal helix-turn-helix domain
VSRVTHDRGSSLEEVRVGIAERLRARRAEIEGTIFARVGDATFGHVGEEEAEYAVGLRTAIAAAVEFGVMAIEQGEGPGSPIPLAAIEQGRRAARFGVSLDTVLRRYIAGHALLADFIMEEADRIGFPGDEALLRHELRTTQTPPLERLTASIIEEYNQELERVGRLPEQRRAELVSKLLAGKQLDGADPLELDYDLDAWHIGLIATGEQGAEFVRSVKATLGCQHLALSRGEQTTWVWFGRLRKPTVADIKRLSIERPEGVSVAMGEPRQGIDGWRLTHGEAQAALPVALRSSLGVTRCSDVLLEAAMLHHDVLAASLVETFLSPLDGLAYRGQTARDTLRAYFEAKRNVSSTANRLRVVRNTVENRLREIEERLGRPLHTCSAQLEVALRLEALNDATQTSEPELLAANWPDVARSRIIRESIEQSAQLSRSTMSTLAIHSTTTG